MTYTQPDDTKINILDTPFNNVTRMESHIIIFDKNDKESVVIDIKELDSIYDIIHSKEV